jgi:hypothetical protein
MFRRKGECKEEQNLCGLCSKERADRVALWLLKQPIGMVEWRMETREGHVSEAGEWQSDFI